ncbi:MAG: hypothetical protein ACI8WB_001340 [Phenylobacterium sp.]|jgi:hypothetical protein
MFNNQATLLTDGSAQAERLHSALQPGYFEVDEMSFETLMALAKDIAAQITFYDLNNLKNGSWAALFERSEVVVMALILSVDCPLEQARFSELLATGWQQPLDYLIKNYGQIDSWYRQLKLTDNSTAFELQMKLSSVIEKSLSEQLKQLLLLIKQLGPAAEKLLGKRLDLLDSIWGIDGQIIMAETTSIHSDQVRTQLYWCFSALTNSIHYLQADTRSYLEQTLLIASHEPAIGLFMVFLKLFKKAQSQLNRFTQRHLEFYYQKLLAFKPLPAVPDSAYLMLTLESGNSTPVQLKAGYQFSAGKDPHFDDIVYCTDNKLTVTDARVEQLNTLYLQRDPLLSPERELSYITRVATSRLSDTKQANASAAISVFGGEDTPASKDPQGNQLSLGLAISDPVLQLAEGERKIEVVIGLGEPFNISSHLLADLDQDKLIQIFAELLAAEPHLFTVSGSPAPEITLLNALADEQLQLVLAATANHKTSQIYKVFLLGLLQLSVSGAADNRVQQMAPGSTFYQLLGQIFSRHTLSRHQWLTPTDLACIEQSCRQLPLDEPLQRVLRLLCQSKLCSFYELYDDMFDIQISSEYGWLPVNGYIIHPLDDTIKPDAVGEGSLYGFKFELPIKSQFPAIIACDNKLHGDTWQTVDPVIRFAIKSQATFYPYSIFRLLALENISIDVEVKGLNDLVVLNHNGRLNPSEPFNPLGSQPNSDGYFVFGAPEMAAKNLTQLAINLNWGELPADTDGFAGHYAQYEQDYSNDSFKAQFSVLKDGLWQVAGNKAGYSLFRSQVGSQTLDSSVCLSVDISHDYKPLRRNADVSQVFEYNLKSRSGFFKLAMKSPQGAFGHQQYAGLLTRTMIENASAKPKWQKAMPNPPYTPLVTRATLDYCARSVIDLANQTTAAPTPAQARVIHLHPFGYEQIYPCAGQSHQARSYSLFPCYVDDGNLLIGLSASDLSGPLTLFFHLDEKAKWVDSPQINWFYLANNQWITLQDQQVTGDTTHGFLTSGLVTLDIGPDINCDNTILPSGLYWLRVSTSKQASGYGRCFGVTTAGVKVTRLVANETRSDDKEQLTAPISISKKWQPMVNIPGLGKASQQTSTFGGRSAENQQQLQQRASERLRHKGRAVTDWDYERLILQQFPAIDRVKCFANTRFGQQGQCPGHVLIVVRLKVAKCDHQSCDHFKISADELSCIGRFVQGLSGPFVTVDVRNPEYEQVQVRCVVTFVVGEQKGLALRKLNRAICDYLCPWQPGGSRGFGRPLEIKALEAFVGQQASVDFVTNFSLLHLAKLGPVERVDQVDNVGKGATQSNSGERFYQLNDSAHRQPEQSGPTAVAPAYPWCLLMPAAEHYLATQSSQVVVDPQRTGIEALSVGENFVIHSSASEHKPTGRAE